MKGDDLLMKVLDVMVTDILNDNMLMKIFSSFTTDRRYKVRGFGYEPGVRTKYDNLIRIISKTYKAPVIVNVIKYMIEVSRGNLLQIPKRK
ncbi:MAG: hypothetical protein K9K32_03895 [Halanaerobiales bacterium]|nr:hypothetical protein [Halanaerobiales bacterium]